MSLCAIIVTATNLIALHPGQPGTAGTRKNTHLSRIFVGIIQFFKMISFACATVIIVNGKLFLLTNQHICTSHYAGEHMEFKVFTNILGYMYCLC